LWLSAARAQEEPLPDPGPPQYVYALDDQTELTLTFHPKDQKTWGAELRLYGEPAQGQIYSFTGDVRLLTKDVYEYKNGTPPTQKQIRVAGKPGEKSPLEISTRNLTGDDSKPVRIHGTFKPVDDAALEARMKKRYEQADAALNDLLKRTLGEVGKSGEAKLKEAFAARLKLRDAAVDPEADHKGLPYWTTMWNATLESVGFLRSYTGRFATKGFAGSYRMPNGNSLELEVVPEEGLKFTAAVLQHAEDKPGVLTGTARLFTTRAVYKEPANKKDAEGRTPVEATFTQHGHIVHLEAKNTDELAGHGVSFDGDYYKVVPRK
ncbi:MAG TPA: hypothetical protein VGO11_00450, partial [Chthoniobacteraceae bacterium]|nr:hypothetical protein [Chthoniobacteraceae bacterium]